jgi:hypothetical protein
MDGDCIVIADQLLYLPVGEQNNGRVIIGELVRTAGLTRTSLI